jgi:nicotinate-nucleotide adenylyltransferase
VRRIGILGGTFDPIHLAHLRCAEEAREALHLDEVLFVPSASPPHKTSRSVSPAADRLAMVKIALAGNPAFRVCSMEIERSGHSYSVDTLRALRQRLPASTALVFLVGVDAFREIGTWKEYRALFGLADVAVLSRPDCPVGRPRAVLPVAARGDFCYGADGRTLLHKTGNRILFLDVTALDISATEIRACVRRGQSIRYLVPAGVERYLSRKRLYRRGPQAS